MRRVFSLYRSSIGKKFLMAVTGVVLVGFVIGHMIGNLKAFQGEEKLDHYAEFLREVGDPFFSHGQALWIFRIVLLVAVAVHIVAAWQLTRQSRAARPEAYRKGLAPDASTWASRSMRIGGVALLAFIVLHILHFTTGTIHPDFVEGGVYHNVTVAFQSPWVTLLYAGTMLLLGLHLFHGIWSGLQTLGLNHARYNRYRRPLATVIALVVAVGFVAMPLAVFGGLIG
jgi:succinate dehydrogenase / fumarate reductase cytochrome b subunit